MVEEELLAGNRLGSTADREDVGGNDHSGLRTTVTEALWLRTCGCVLSSKFLALGFELFTHLSVPYQITRYALAEEGRACKQCCGLYQN